MTRVASYKDLIAWRKAVALANTVYAATRSLPQDDSGLLPHIRRAAVSVASRIAEGSARNTRAEFLQFLHTARGTLAELDTQMIIAAEQGLIPADASALEDIAELSKLLNDLTTKLASSHREAHANACKPNVRLHARNQGSDRSPSH